MTHFGGPSRSWYEPEDQEYVCAHCGDEIPRGQEVFDEGGGREPHHEDCLDEVLAARAEADAAADDLVAGGQGRDEEDVVASAGLAVVCCGLWCVAVLVIAVGGN